jgi:hypothetical protein
MFKKRFKGLVPVIKCQDVALSEISVEQTPKQLERCSVCHTSIANQQFILLHCGHLLHIDCVKQMTNSVVFECGVCGDLMNEEEVIFFQHKKIKSLKVELENVSAVVKELEGTMTKMRNALLQYNEDYITLTQKQDFIKKMLTDVILQIKEDL